MRLFVALPVPEAIKQYLRSIRSRIEPFAKETGTILRFTADFHLTLKFLGAVDVDKQKEIDRVLRTVALRPFTAALSKIGFFSFRGLPRVVYAGISAPEWLLGTQKAMEEKLDKIGFPAEHRFSPHLTLARVKSSENGSAFQKSVSAITMEQKKFSVSEFCLFQSHLSKKGATYEKVIEYPAT